MDLFAGVPVSDYQRAIDWYNRLLGAEPAFFPNDVEAVWQLAEHRYLYIAARESGTGFALNLLFVEDMPERVAAISARGIEPAAEETYDNGVRKVTYRDPDGNEFSFGGNTQTT